MPLSDAVNGTTIFQFSGDTLLRYRKDNREVPQVIYELTAVTDNENIIIGSGLMRNCKLVTSGVVEPICVGFYDKLNSIDSVVNVYYDENNNLVIENGAQIDFTIQPNGISAINNSSNVFSSWALIAPGKAKSITVEDDDGFEIQQVINNVGEIIIGENKELYAGTSTLWFSVKSDVYDKI